MLESYTDAERALAQSIASARGHRRAIAAGPTPSLESAYRVQRLLRDGRERRGYKIGMVSPAERAQFQMSEPVYAPVYASMLLSDRVSLSQFIQPRLEPELAVVLSADVPVSAPPGEAALAIDGAFLAVDILDTVWSGYRLEPTDAVADGVNGGAFLLGDQLLPLGPDGELALHVDGERLTGRPVTTLGDPVLRCGWLADSVGGLQAGEIVFLGSPAASVAARPGVLEVHGPRGAYLAATLQAA